MRTRTRKISTKTRSVLLKAKKRKQLKLQIAKLQREFDKAKAAVEYYDAQLYEIRMAKLMTQHLGDRANSSAIKVAASRSVSTIGGSLLQSRTDAVAEEAIIGLKLKRKKKQLSI